MRCLNGSLTTLFLYCFLAFLLLSASTAMPGSTQLSPRLDEADSLQPISERQTSGPPAPTKANSKRPGQQPTGPRQPWNPQQKNKVVSEDESDGGEAPEDVGENDVHVEPAKVPKHKESKIKKKWTAAPPNRSPCAGEQCDTSKNQICTLMIGAPHTQEMTTCCSTGQFADEEAYCCPLKWLNPNTNRCCTKMNKKKCKDWKAYWNSHMQPDDGN